MPRIFGLNVVGVLVASVAFFMVGYAVYGAIFSELWMSLQGVSEADVEAAGMGWLAPAFLITVLQMTGLATILKWRGVSDIMCAVLTAVAVWAFFGLPLMAYDPIYVPGESPMLLVIDGVHLFFGWIVGAIVLAVLK
ncbi:MAG: DUF1761 domain-containing protein [Pseudomonadota bacterium]